MSQKRAGQNVMESKYHSVTARLEQSVHLETKCSRVKLSQGKMSLWMFQVGLNVTVDETWADVKAPELHSPYSKFGGSSFFVS
jgi:hypothetical protein